MKPPKISVVIPSFNKVKFIGKTLDSIIGQKYPNLEVIIQDGGSTDGTLDVIKKYAARYPDVIKFESKGDRGQLEAINKGMGKATGEILTFINADDMYEPEALDYVAQSYSENTDSLWFAGRGKVVDKGDKEIAKAATSYKNLLLSLNSGFLLLVTNYLMQPSVFITRKAWEKFGLFKGTGKFVMEYDLWLALGADSMPVVIDKCLSDFRISEGNITSNSFKDTLKEDYRVIKKYTKNPFILFLHQLNNWGRVFVINTLKV